MRSVCLFLLVWGVSASAVATDLRPQVSASWLGETFTHAGGRVGVDVTAFEAGGHRLLFGSDLGVYRHPGFHTGLLLDAVGGYRFTFDFGLFLEARLGVGYLHTFLDGDTFHRSDNGGFEQAWFAGGSAFAPLQSVAVGYDLLEVTDLPLSFFAGITSFQQMPFNTGWMQHVAGQIGVAWEIGGKR